MMLLPMASGPFFSLNNTDFVVLLGFVVFIGVLLYFKVPGLITGMLDQRADKIRQDLDEARQLREEAQSVVASFERKQKAVVDQAASIIAAAKTEADNALVQAKADLAVTIERRKQAAIDQIESAEQAAVREVRDRAVTVAVAAASDVLAQKMDPSKSGAMIDASISEVGAKLH